MTEKTQKTKKFGTYIIVLLISGLMILVGQWIGYDKPIMTSLPGLLLVLLIAFISLLLKEFLPLKFPAFAWASLLALLLSMPFMPTAGFFLKYTNEVVFLGTTTPILAFAGISVGNKLGEFKKLGWKVFVVAIFVFAGTFFGSAIVANIIMSLTGLI
jgi:hypothetical protein